MDLLDQAILAATRARLLSAMPPDDPEREITAARVQLVVLRARGFQTGNTTEAPPSLRMGAGDASEGDVTK